MSPKFEAVVKEGPSVLTSQRYRPVDDVDSEVKVTCRDLHIAAVYCSCPTTNGGVHTSLHVWHRFVCSVGASTKFLHRSSVGSLLRVRCWLGSTILMMDINIVR